MAFDFIADDVHGKIKVKHQKEDSCRLYMYDQRIYDLGIDTLPNIKFWRRLVKLHPDSGLVSAASTRNIVGVITVDGYKKMTDVQKDIWRDSIRKFYTLPDSEKILFTKGKGDFYQIEKVMADIGNGIKIFEANNTDPFYAQAILLIESPGRLQKSTVGAYGPFQLMKGVARNMGLTVNKYVDERKDFDKSAYAAARLIRTICIPYTNAMLDERGIKYNQTDLWYRLLILHVYHAGAGNVKKALDASGCCEGNIDLIKKLWYTKAGAFGTASQSYSQVALACTLELYDLIHYYCEEIYHTHATSN